MGDLPESGPAHSNHIVRHAAVWSTKNRRTVPLGFKTQVVW
jgi:hypothetical protein